MGGFGSGRSGWRGKVEHCRSLDIYQLHRAGCLRPGWMPIWSRDNQSKTLAVRQDLGLTVSPDSLAAGSEGQYCRSRASCRDHENRPCIGRNRTWSRASGTKTRVIDRPPRAEPRVTHPLADPASKS